jgi:hypothetical protein
MVQSVSPAERPNKLTSGSVPDQSRQNAEHNPPKRLKNWD